MSDEQNEDEQFKLKMGISKRVHVLCFYSSIILFVLFFFALYHREQITGWWGLIYPILLSGLAFIIGFWRTGNKNDGLKNVRGFLILLIIAIILGLMQRSFKSR